MARGARKDPNLKLTEQLAKVEERLFQLQERKKNLLDPILEKERILEEKRNELQTQINSKQRTEMMELLIDSGLTYEELKDLIQKQSLSQNETEVAATKIDEN